MCYIYKRGKGGNMRVSQFEPFIGEEEYLAIKECFDTKWITEGPKSKQFAEKLCEMIGVKYGVFAPNGTLALYLALRSMGIGPGDEVLVPNFTFIASANAVEMVGATPVFVDIKLSTLQVDIESCKEHITTNTKAIMPVHIYGSAANMDEVVSFSRKHRLMVIEDAAQALGVKWAGKNCGTFGDVATFSFFADKTLTTGEGGFVVTNRKDIYDKLKFLRNQGRTERGSFIHPQIGYNFRLNDIQSSIGLAQLEKFEEIVKRKNHIFTTYKELLGDITGAHIVSPVPEVSPFIPFRVILMCDKKSAPIMNFLERAEIETRTLFYPLHRQPCFESVLPHRPDSELKNSIKAYRHGLCLPSYPSLEREKIIYVCDKIKEFLR